MKVTATRPESSARARGFTLMEVAVAIVIVGIGLMYVLEGLNTAKLTAAHTHNMKLARELALLTLGEIESGVFQEDIEAGLRGSYAQEDYPDFAYEVLVGDDAFPEQQSNGQDRNAWSPQRARDEERKRDQAQKDKQDDKDKKEQTDEPFEKVKIRVTFPKFNDLPNELILERWVPWKQVYGESDEAKDEKQKQDKKS